MKIDDKAPRSTSGREHPNRRAILLAANALPVEEVSERMYVSVTNYDDDTFLMKFEVGPLWDSVKQYLHHC